MSVVKRAAAENQQVLEFVRVTVVKHFGNASVCHHVWCAGRKLVEYFLVVQHEHVHALVLFVDLCQAVCLFFTEVVCENEHFRSSRSVNVLVFNVAGDFRGILFFSRVECYHIHAGSFNVSGV